MKSSGIFTSTEWVMWLGAAVTAGVSIVHYAYSEFSTKKEVTAFEERIDTDKKSLDKRLERMENKIDLLLFNLKSSD
jgi:cell division protein FtsL